MATCPNCKAEVDVQAAGCAACDANFTARDGWRPIPTDAAEAARVPQGGRRQDGDSMAGRLAIGFLIMMVGALYGVACHDLFGRLFSTPEQGRSGLMMGSFLFGVPLLVGAIYVILLSRYRRVGVGQALAGSSVLIVLFVFLAGVLLREGFICIVMALPLFLVFGAIGGLLSLLVSVLAKDKGPKLLGVAIFVPFLAGALEEPLEPPVHAGQLTRSVHIRAQPDVVWRHINFPLDIQPAELSQGWAYRIGVPYPIEARTLEPRVGGLRELAWQRGVKFQEEITQFDPGRLIAWRYRFGPDSFPPGSLDEHIVIGGRYFGLEDTSYTLTPEAGGTRLDITVNYRVSTQFNWYARPWARFLIGDTAETILAFYKRRSERG